MSGFDWPGLMRTGLRELGLKPDEFWALTPAELWLLLGPEAGEMPMGRGRLDELSQSYPDGELDTDIGADDG
ncbi:MAG: rcc01693 family protein [Octadecabacter sp.]